jgi:hypothetical protein
MMTSISKKSKTALAAFIAASQLYALAPAPGLAADAEVRVAGQSVIAIPRVSPSASPEVRAAAIQKNLDNALVASTDKSPSAVKIIYVKGLPVITLGGYRIVTIDATTAKALHTTPATLASRWAGSIKQTLSDSSSVNDYVAQLTGTASGAANQIATTPPAVPIAAGAPACNPANSPAYSTNPPPVTQAYPVQQGRVVYIPAGMVIPVKLATGISTEVAQPGDRIEATVSQPITLDNGVIPAGSIVVGQVVESESARRLGRSGELNLKFQSIRTPDGAETPISAHIIGGVAKYSEKSEPGADAIAGETTKNKVESAAIRGAVGAGAGALLGTAIGAIAGGGHGTGRGAWSGAAIGGGLGVADSLLLRKGANVQLKSGEPLQLQLDAPAQLAVIGGGNL